jgi:predicted AlkP superfamily phosphohydrolase/phosphomutase
LQSFPIHEIKSPAVWTTILTGTLPNKHGITDFRINGSPPKSYHRKVAAIWNMLGDFRTSAHIGFWATWPPEAINGIMVSDYLGLRSDQDTTEEFKSGSRPLTHPPTFLDEISDLGLLKDRRDLIQDFYARFTEGEVPEEEQRQLFGHWLNVYATIYWQDRVFKDIGEYVLSQYQPDLTTIYFQGIDSVQHLFWAYHEPEKFENISPKHVERYGDVINEYYSLMDQWIGSITALVDENTTIAIVSDHGARAKPLKQYRKDRNSRWYHLSGAHDVNGVLILVGPTIKESYTLEQARVQDITPTLLYLLGLPVGLDMAGEVLTDAVTPPFKRAQPIYTIPGYSRPQVATSGDSDFPELDDKAIERLKALGYIK